VINETERTPGPVNIEKPIRIPRAEKLLPALLVVSILAVYLPSISHPFVFDDIPELVHNSDVLTFTGCLDTVSRSRNTGLSGRPVACLTFAANVAVAGFSVRAFHLVNITIHIAAALALFGILRRTISPIEHPSTHSPTALAGVITLIWALHPLQTESVTYIIQRIESLAGFWYLLTLYCAIRARDSDNSLIWIALSVPSCAFGMLTKEIVVTAPLIVFLYDKVFTHRAIGDRPKRRTSLYVALAATWIIPVALNISSPRGGSAGFGLGVSALDYLRTQAGVIIHYLQLCFWPFPQAISYSDWPIVRDWISALPPGLFVLALLIGTVVGLAKRKWWGFCGAWFFLILAPSSSVVPVVTEPAAERRMYLPLAAVIAVSAFLLLFALQAIQFRPKARRIIAAGATIIIVVGLITATIFQNADYATAVRILTSTLNARPGDELVRGALVEELVKEKRIDLASTVQMEGIARNPYSYILYDNWARAMHSIGRYPDAINAYSKAIEIRPDHYPSRAGLGATLIESGRYLDALDQLTEAARLAPHAHTVRGNLAVALAALGRTDEAIAQLRTAIELKPSFADAHFNLARLLAGQQKSSEALVHFRIAATLRPDDVEIQRALAAALQSQKNADQAPAQ
jgi:protein O-mannosyl-transferase